MKCVAADSAFSNGRHRCAALAVAVVSGLWGCGGGQTDSGAAQAAPPAAASSPAAIADVWPSLDRTGVALALERGDTLSGPDADGNGVRDDIDALIDTSPGTSARQHAMKAFSRALTAATTADPADATGLRDAAASLNAAVACLWTRFDGDEAGRIADDLRRWTINTRTRFDAYMAYQRARDGAVVTLATGCAP